MRRPTAPALGLVLLLVDASGTAQQAAPATPSQAEGGTIRVAVQPPRPGDVASIDGMMKAFYDVISGPAGAPREWGRDRTLYIPGVRFVAIGVEKDGRVRPRVMSHQEFVEATDPGFVKEGFYEREVHRTTWRFGSIAHVLSTYESRRAPDGPVTGRGVNSVELHHDGQRWWISSAQWDEERPGNPLPKDLLPPRQEP